jgi:hypothetical protein
MIQQSEVLSSNRKCLEDRLAELKIENSRLQQLVAELLLKNQTLRESRHPSQSGNGILSGEELGL